jgi:Na+/H+ antiporter NhaC
VALCALMPISTCALFWAAILDQQPVTALLAFIAFALNGLLMLAYLPYYRDVLQRRTLAFGEA